MLTVDPIGSVSGLAMKTVSAPALLEDLILALLVSLGVCALNIFTERWHGRYSGDLDTAGIQKVHNRTVPRTGGIALVAGVLAVALYGNFGVLSAAQDEGRKAMVALLVAAMPAFLAGIIEDLTKTVSPRTRLYSIVASAFLAAWLLSASLPRLDIWGLDNLLGLLPVSLAITVFAVAGVTNSINIIDGFHGVAGGSVAIILAGAAYLSWQAGDTLVTQLAIAGIGATIGFLMLNYPTGRLFMGDGGAYFLGFWAAEIAVLLVVRNPHINTWQVLAIYAYPVMEVVFSIYRRKLLHNTLTAMPDRLHLHSLLYRRFTLHRINVKKYPWTCNAGVACFITAWIALATCASVLFGKTIPAALALVLIQAILYVAVYMRLVRGHWGHCRNLTVILGLRPQPRKIPTTSKSF